MFITTCNLQRTSLGGRLCSRGRRWSRQPRSPTVPRADAAPSGPQPAPEAPRARFRGLVPHRSSPQPSVHHPRDWEAISVPGRRGPRPSIGPSSQAPERAGRRDAGGRALPWRPRELPCPPMIARPRRWMVTPGAALTHGDGANRTGSPGGSAAPRRRAAATASDSARCGHSAPGGGRTPGPRETGPRDHPRLSHPGATGKAWRGPGDGALRLQHSAKGGCKRGLKSPANVLFTQVGWA